MKRKFIVLMLCCSVTTFMLTGCAKSTVKASAAATEEYEITYPSGDTIIMNVESFSSKMTRGGSCATYYLKSGAQVSVENGVLKVPNGGGYDIYCGNFSIIKVKK